MFNFTNSTQFNNVNLGTQWVSEAGVIGLGVFNDWPRVKVTNNLRPPGSALPLGSHFGEFSSARAPRILQLAVKLYF
ncbi:MAG: hypothetical protein NZV14_03730 [Bryobacteraceae bacterium]|nr:hypothetical protein [Bryobacteraceae bacterium]MDW8377242.1 hypothetical protein [Bryobacterales bacterium]